MSSNPRVYLWVAFALLLWLNYEAWMADYGPRPGPSTASVSAQSTASVNDLSNAIPSAPSVGSTPGAAHTLGASAPSSHPESESSAVKLIHVRTDVMDVLISTRGGTIEKAALTQYPLVKGQPAPIELENDDGPVTRYLLQSGLTGSSESRYPDHLALFTSPEESYELGNQAELRVPLTWTNGQGLTFTKTYVFRRGEYRIGLEQDLKNRSSLPVEVAPYLQIVRNDPPTKSSMFNVNMDTRSYHGPVYYDGSRYRKLNVNDRDDSHLSRQVTGGWIAATQHHFVTAVVPPAGKPYHFEMSTVGDEYRLSATGPIVSVPPGGSAQFLHSLYIGPKLQAQLDQTGPRLELVTDYGYLAPLAKPLFWLLERVHAITGNWGFAIIFVTFLLKLVFYPLQESSGRTMAKMKNLTPRTKNLQDLYKDDREKLSRAMMELYQREKVNPISGCLPILVQIPVFVAFYWVLMESVEMRQAPFILWIRDLSSRDPWFVLPAIMAGAMFLQYRMNPTSPDPMQARIFMIMPIFMSIMFAFFPAGLVLYWVTNTLLSIAQQWNINRRIAMVSQKA
jgi:YidC/Oxa1 family membrane protein insertase